MSSSVLIPLLKKNNVWHILFEVRSASIAQGGEVCFPGGHMEPGESAEAAAIRETAEELLISKDRISDVRPSKSVTGPHGRDVAAFSGILSDYAGTYSKDEVDHIFTVPLEELQEMKPSVYPAEYRIHLPENFPYDKIPGGRHYPWAAISRNLYFYEAEGHVIWGLTGEILYRFLELSHSLHTKTVFRTHLSGTIQPSDEVKDI